MRLPPRAWISLFLPALAACAGGPQEPERGLLQDEGSLLCPGGYTTGRGNVWRGGDPGRLEERELPCLEGSGRLAGYFIGSIVPSRGETAFSADNLFLYGLGDDRLNQVEAYYVVTHMANWIVGRLAPPEEFTVAIEVMRSDQVTLDYNKQEVESQQLCYSLNQGIQGLEGTVLNVDVLSHEFGHHLVFSLNRQISNAMIHEALADYLAAAFTRDPVIEPSRWPGFDRSLENNLTAPGDIISRGQYCAEMLNRMEKGGMVVVYPELADTFRRCRDENSSAPEPHWAGQILGAVLWELRGTLGEEVWHPMLFLALHSRAVGDTGEFLESLIEADAHLNQGANEELLRQVFAARGLAANLSLDFPELPYPQCP